MRAHLRQRGLVDQSVTPIGGQAAVHSGGHHGYCRVAGTAVFLSRGNKTAPLALRANVEHNHVLHERVVIATIDTLPIPRVSDSERIEIDPLGHTNDGIIHVTERLGYMETPDIRRA